MDFKLVSDYKPTGDQPEAIEQLVSSLRGHSRHNTLLGVTGSGKTFTMANVIAQLNKPTLILSHNKTLAAQLYGEFKNFFPENAVEYFVSYYDYYQPEAYLPTTDTYIEKDLSINEGIEKMRLSTTSSLLSGRNDIVVVSSVSCIYGIGNPEDFHATSITLKVGDIISRNKLLYGLVDALYTRSETEFKQGTFRVKGDTVDIYIAYGDKCYRVVFYDNEIEAIYAVDPMTGQRLESLERIVVYPANLFVTTRERIERAIREIQLDLGKQCEFFESVGRPVEARRLKQRVEYDLEMIKELGYCPGIENYSRYFDGRAPGSRPFCLIDYFPKDYLLLIDESHVTLPQVRGMYGGDRSRKESLINFGFRLLACIQITDAGTHQNADAERIFILHGNAGICKRFFCCRNGILGESSHSSCRLEIHAFFCHEAFDLACQMYFIFCCIKFRNRSDSAGSLADAVPEFLHGISNRGYRTQPCDDYSSLHSNSPFLRSPCRRRSESPVR